MALPMAWICTCFMLLGCLACGEYISDNVNVESSDPNDVGFFFHANQKNLSDWDELRYNDPASLTDSRFNPNHSILIVLVHGYTQNHTSAFPRLLRNAYLRAGYARHANLLTINWGKLATPKNPDPLVLVGNLLQLTSYRQAMDNVPVVGRRVADFLVFLQEEGMIRVADTRVHLIGHSLGAHVCGMAGLFRRRSAGVSLTRITGTDPAMPGYQQRPAEEKLDASDASFVDVVHTDSGEYGEYVTLGHADFFVNGGGPNQPDCAVVKDPTQSSCPHNLAPRYFAMSLSTTSLKACPQGAVPPPMQPPPCLEETKVTFGQHCPTTARGSFGIALTLGSNAEIRE